MISSENRYSMSMDDEADEVVVHQTLFSHMKILSHFIWSLPLNAASFWYVSQHLWSYMIKPETLAVSVALVLLLVVYNSNEPWCQKLKLFRLLGKKRTLLSASDLLSDHESWVLEKENCGIFALRGKRPHMEDRYSVIQDEESGISLYGVFDGHGGASAAIFAEKYLFKTLLKKLTTAIAKASLDAGSSSTNADDNGASVTKEIAQLLTEEILAIDLKLLTKVKASQDVAGTTALVAAVHKNQLIVANVGDSRGVICDSKGNAIPLSFDHKPQQLKEHRRIKEAGGFITFNGVWRVAGVLATSRALGDFPLKDRNLVIAEPDILTFNLSDMRPQFMVLATDGLWDTFSNEEAVAFIKDHLEDPLHGAKSLALQAYKKGSLDNITVLIVVFS